MTLQKATILRLNKKITFDVFLSMAGIELKDGEYKFKRQTKEKVLKITFQESLIFGKENFKEAFSDWGTEKLNYYYLAAISWSDEGNKYVNWTSAISQWAKRAELEGKLKFKTQTDALPENWRDPNVKLTYNQTQKLTPEQKQWKSQQSA